MGRDARLVALLGFNPCCPGSASSTPGRRECQWEERCFNPCCPGSASSTPDPEPVWRYPPGVSILVVLDRPPQHLLAQRHAGNRGSFNPCCPGSASSTYRSGLQLFLGSKFQSLLSWIGLLNIASGGVVGSILEFQSLLSWIGLLNVLWRLSQDGVIEVSILVVLDRPPQPG